MSSTRFGWFGFRPSSLQCFNTPKWLLTFLCLFYFCLSMVINGTYSVSVSTIEKRFGLSSSVMGIVTSMYDVACLFVTVFVSYYGGQQSKSRWLGWGLFILGVANFVFVLPHLIIGKYEAGERQLPDVCTVNSTNFNKDTCDNKALGKWYYPAIFCLGMFLIGIAGAPLYVLGVAYLDESVKKKVAPIYIGFFGSSGTVGAAAGFLLGGIFLSIYVDTGATTELATSDPRWVGNWWIGNVIGIVMAIFLSIWMLGFPRTIPRKYRNSIASQNNGSDESHVFQFSEVINHMDIKKLPSVTKELFSIPGYIFLCIGSALEYFVMTAAMAFFPKVIYVLFNTPLSELSWLYGSAVVLPILAGQVLGAYINKKMELNGIQATKTVCITTFLSMIVGALYLTTQCSGQDIIGLTAPAGNRTNKELITSCNLNCDCKHWSYFPVCDRQRTTTYRSPCIARCTTKQEAEKIFSGCRCSGSDELAYGKCPSKCGTKAAIFVFLTALFGFTSFLGQTPTVIAILRSVPGHLKAYALGWQMIFIRSLGAIPGPIIYGKLIDTTCILWQYKCGSRGNCLEYDNGKLIYVTAAVAVISKFFTTLFFVLAWKFLKTPPPMTVETNGNGGINYRESNDISDTTLIRTENV